MTRSVLNALKAVAVLVCITVVCVGLLAVCNRFFPKYVPTLDGETAQKINALTKACDSDEKAYSDGYIVMLYDDDYKVSLSAYNKDNKSKKAEILAVYGVKKGDKAGTYVVECSAQGRDSTVVLLIAYRDDTVTAASVKKQNESYWAKLPEEEKLFATLIGKSGAVDLKSDLGKTGATVSLTAIDRAVNMANGFAADYGKNISALLKGTNGGEAKGAAYD